MDSKTALVALLVVLLLTDIPWTAGNSLGAFKECAHELKGTVEAVNPKKVKITGFHYDGKGPGAVFIAMHKGQTKVSTKDGTYDIIPFPQADPACDKVAPLSKQEGTSVEVVLPKEIKEYASFGVYCAKFCANFGHVVIPADFAAPEGEETVGITACTVKTIKIDDVEECDDGGFNEIAKNCEPKPPDMTTAGTVQLVPTAAAALATCTAAAIWFTL